MRGFRRGHPRRWIAHALLAFVACTVAPGTILSQARSDTIVKLAGAPQHPGGGTLVEELTIGAASGPPEYTFNRVGSFLLGRDGTVWILDAQNGPTGEAFLRQYDANGKFIRTVGRKGGGPGEFSFPSGLAQLPDGRILLIANGGFINARPQINVYSPAGASLATWILTAVIPFQPAVTDVFAGEGLKKIATDTAGIVYLPLTAQTRGLPVEHVPVSFVRLTSTGVIIDTIPEPALPNVSLPTKVDTLVRPGDIMAGLPTRGMEMRLIQPAYSPASSWHLSPLGYFVTGVSTRYGIDLRMPRVGSAATPGSARRPVDWHLGDPVISLRRNVPPIQITAAERASTPGAPLVKPAFRNFSVADDGRIWVLVSLPSESYTPDPPPSGSRQPARPPWREPNAYDLFEPDGAYVGRITAPYSFDPVAIRGDVVWARVVDTDGVQVAKRYRVVWK